MKTRQLALPFKTPKCTDCQKFHCRKGNSKCEKCKSQFTFPFRDTCIKKPKGRTNPMLEGH